MFLARRTCQFPFRRRLSDDDGVGGTVLALAGRECHLQEGRQDVVSVLFVGGGETIFAQETPIAEAVLDFWIVVDDIGWRCYENYFDVLLWN